MSISIACPHCRTLPIARSSRELSATMRELRFICANPDCGHTWIAHLEIVRTLSPSACPNPEVRIPLSPHVRRAVMQQLELCL
jgi:predicted RNA-binding Zn-ribbon protein involved in translation (DUF1610 family)